jgi:Clp amino terminal domain, pathogenicity island component
MFERFTDEARTVVVRAQDQARLLKHNYVGTEHILLGLIAEQHGLAARALTSLDVRLDAVREQVIQIIGVGAQPVPASEHIPFTPRAKKVLELSLRDALQLGSNSIGTEHILLGLLREGHGVAVVILGNLAGDPRTVRRAVMAVLHHDLPEGVRTSRPERIPAAIRPQPGILAMLRDIDARLANIEAHLGIRKVAGLPGDRPGAAESPEAGASAVGEASAGGEAEAGGEARAGSEAEAGGEARAGSEAEAGGEAQAGSEAEAGGEAQAGGEAEGPGSADGPGQD